ncbi:Eco57I restriction-modification methylase domain-containing protein [Capnocytophaga sp. oral taxon 338]|uniref:Eco57I restriction-modification methylase domain-containing protein n=1 Tax=Capnocytophaga sp. oral taxon 338 TaxID=710239 RepID=UPI000202F142|nr:TaqI-like C-terminal specificity domain-containing protein [Capnocytophaga sp. oral taxon 338]EGD33589.1 type IIS restriction endonuclease [Capnocytophaga sp. oral taxon 338 str. F0234]
MENIIHTFKSGNLFEATTFFFKHLNISTQTFEEQAFLPQDFLKNLYKPEKHKVINEIYLVGMVTDEVFSGKSLAEIDNELSYDYQGLLIIAVDLEDKTATRTELSTLTRLFNRRFNAMPVAVLFRYGNHIALANAERTEYKQAFREGEKIGKVSILKDIDTLNPHRGHLDILETLKIPAKIKTFKDLYKHWQEVFNVSTLNKKFYNELFAWYQWTISEEVGVTYPNDTQTDQDDRVQLEEQIIRLITRVLFVWFIKQKQLVPNKLFEEDSLNQLLKDFKPTSLSEGSYYNAILQNLFFATLNKKVTERAFAKAKNTRDVKTLYRYEEMFNCSEEEVIKLFAPIPFLNGGLFECLDKDKGNDGVRYHLDGFSRNDRRSQANGHYTHRAFIPNAVFFDKEKGLFPLLNRYHFTIEENSPNDVQVALDPELLGNVFENLLGAFNPETKESARKQSGSFYTPKEVVHYMVDESLKAYLKNHLPQLTYENLEELFEENGQLTTLWSTPLRTEVAQYLRKVKILDPACGSGAFPMGILSRMVQLLEKLNTNEETSLYDLKLHLIENCIYGVDIQNIASQISKLRFFISLIVEQKESNTDAENNYGVHTLPNLETKFITANTLISIREKKASYGSLFDIAISEIREALIEIRKAHFYAKNPYQKKQLREKDEALREVLAQKLEEFGQASSDNAKEFVHWNPYDQNASASFFDPEWMFGISDGFDIVIGNPPYFSLTTDSPEKDKRTGTPIKHNTLYEKQGYETFARTGDIYCLFYEKAHQLLKQGGICNFITSNKWMRTGYGQATRKFFLEHTNPLILVDFAGIKVFETATVDVNILLYVKEKPTFNTWACTIKDNELKKLSLYVRQHGGKTTFSSDESWVILSEIEQRIKAKIEAIGTPLKEWNISINYGIKTGFNDAFIINGEKRAELIAQDPKSAEIIRPILRGRDIKRYGYEFADLYLLFIPWHFPLHQRTPEIKGASKEAEKAFENQYPAIYNHLLQYKEELSNRNKAETGIRYEWYALQRWGANYWEDFYKQKIVYPETTQGAYFALDTNKVMLDKTCFMIISDKPKFLIALLSSRLYEFSYKSIFSSIELGVSGYQYNKHALIRLPIIEPSQEIEQEIITLLDQKEYSKIDTLVYKLYNLSEEEIIFIESI